MLTPTKALRSEVFLTPTLLARAAKLLSPVRIAELRAMRTDLRREIAEAEFLELLLVPNPELLTSWQQAVSAERRRTREAKRTRLRVVEGMLDAAH
jgi:signal transduction protein with GAF and PtsI domain